MEAFLLALSCWTICGIFLKDLSIGFPPQIFWLAFSSWLFDRFSTLTFLSAFHTRVFYRLFPIDFSFRFSNTKDQQKAIFVSMELNTVCVFVFLFCYTVKSTVLKTQIMNALLSPKTVRREQISPLFQSDFFGENFMFATILFTIWKLYRR